MTKHYLALWLSLVLVGCAGCLAVKLRDCSGTEKYRPWIGSTFALKEEFKVYGVLADLRDKQPSMHKMIPAAGPGIGGPELVDWSRLPAGTRLRLVVASEETLTGKTVYQVEVIDPPPGRPTPARIQISNTYGFHLYTRETLPGGAPKLDPARFSEFTPAQP